MKLQDSQEYKDWIGDQDVVAENENAYRLITVTRNTDLPPNYNVYRTFAIGENVAVSVDLSDVDAEAVFAYLFQV